MFKNLVNIITGKTEATSGEIKTELSALTKAKEEAEFQAASLKETLKAERLNLLAGKTPAKAIESLKAKIAKTDDEIQAMTQATVDLESLLKKILAQEGNNKIKEFEAEILELKNQEKELKSQFTKDAAKLAVSYHLLTGRNPFHINDMGNPFHVTGPDYEPFKTEVNTLMNEVGVSIPEAIRGLEYKVRKITTQIS